MNQALPAPELADLVEEFDLGSARGGRKPSGPLEITVSRALVEADLPLIANPPPVAQSAPSLTKIRASHHRLAQLIAEGKGGAEISRITGYSQSYLSIIQGDPAFEELVAYYSAQREEVFIDAQQRLRALGLDATEKLHEHLHDPNKVWSHRELMEVIKLALPGETTAKSGHAGVNVNVNSPKDGGGLEIRFVSAGAPAEPGPVLDGKFTEVQGEG